MSYFRTFLRAWNPACVVAVAILSPVAATAQTRLDAVVVTGTREPQPLRQSAADVVVIGADTIRDSSADSVADLLRREAGMQITRNGGPGQSSGFFIRGASTTGTVVLIDGVRVGSASLGQAEFESLSLAQIDHIEVLRGPASSLYGADAVGGVVQIFTRRGDGAPRVAGNAAIGGYRSREGDLGISGSRGPFDYAILGGRESSRGVSTIRPDDRFGYFNPDDDGYGLNFGNLQLGYSPAAGHRIGIVAIASKLNAQYDSADFRAPTYAPDPSPDFRNHLKTSLVSINYRGVISPLWTTALQASKNVDDANTSATTSSHFKTDRTEETWQNALHFGPDHQVMLAYEHLHESVSGDVFADKPGRSNSAFVLGYSGQFGRPGLQASIRHDDNSVYGNNTTGSLGATYRLLPQLMLRALAGTTFRAPTFNDLFYPGYGVSTVKAERGTSLEVGAAWQSDGTSATATVYRNRVRNLIAYDPDSAGTDCPPGYFGCAANVGRARLHGATLTGAQQWGRFDARATVDFLSATDANTGARLARRAAHQETVEMNYTQEAWSAGATLVDVGARPEGGIVLGGYGVLDLRAAWRFQPQWRLEAKLLNALDHRVEPVRDYQGLGRQAWIGVRFDGKGL